MDKIQMIEVDKKQLNELFELLQKFNELKYDLKYSILNNTINNEFLINSINSDIDDLRMKLLSDIELDGYYTDTKKESEEM